VPKPEWAPKLKLIHLTSAGINQLEGNPIYTSTNIPITTSSGIHGPQISEWVIMGMLSAAHRLPQILTWQRERHWGHFGFEDITDFPTQRMGILGYGSIGRQCARVASAMGMDVIAYTAGERKTPESRKDTGYIVPNTGDPDGSIPSAWFSGTSKSDLHHFLSQDIDVLVVSIPLTPATKHLLSSEEFAVLGKRGAFISNISRGGIIDQPALIAACKKPVAEGGLRGAALDVTDPEPLPSDHPLWDVENIFVSPHVSGITVNYLDRSMQVLELNLTRLIKGEKLVNEVNRKKGY
jgi:phosphoglycerate dehydrogenase-like enzyme